MTLLITVILLITLLVVSIYCFVKATKVIKRRPRSRPDVNQEIGGSAQGNLTIEPEVEVDMKVDNHKVELDFSLGAPVLMQSVMEPQLELDIIVETLEFSDKIDANSEFAAEIES